MTESSATLGQRLTVGVLRLMAWLPLPINHLLGHALGLLLKTLPNHQRKIANKNLQLCFPDWEESARNRLLTQSLVETAKSTTEISSLWTWPKRRIERLIQGTTGAELIDQARAQNKGVIILLPHLGCWEMVNLYLSLNYPLCSLYRPPRNPALEPLMNHGRERFGAKLVPTNNQGVRALFKALKENQIILILPDQNPAEGSGVFAPFFGVQAHTMVLLNRLAVRSGAKVLSCFAERLPQGRGYHINIQEPQNLLEGETPEQAATAINEEVERCVRQLPAQYQWTYKRFKTRPQGEPRRY